MFRCVSSIFLDIESFVFDFTAQSTSLVGEIDVAAIAWEEVSYMDGSGALEELSPSVLTFNLLLGVVLSVIVAWYYARFGEALSNRAKFARLMLLMCLLIVLAVRSDPRSQAAKSSNNSVFDALILSHSISHCS